MDTLKRNIFLDLMNNEHFTDAQGLLFLIVPMLIKSI